MSWTTRITKAPSGEVRLLFPEPLRQLDMDRATAAHFAKLIATAADEKVVGLLDAAAASDARGGAPALAPDPLRNSRLSPQELATRRRGCLVSLCSYKPHGSVTPSNDIAEPDEPPRWVQFRSPAEVAAARAQLLAK